MKKQLGIASIFLLCLLCLHFILVDYNYTNMYKQIEKVEDFKYTGVVVSEGIDKEYKTNYTIQLKNKKYNNFRILMSVKKTSNEFITLQYGDVISFNGKLELPSVARNSGGFSYRDYLKTKKIVGIITCKYSDISKIGKQKVSFFTSTLNAVASHVKNVMQTILPERTAGIATAMLIGERTTIPENINTYFQNSSLTHMLAISGSHIVYIILLVSILCQRVGNRFSKIVLIICLILYIFLTQMTPSVTRACIMAIMGTMASFIHRKSNVYVNLVVATAILLWINPYNIWDMGFQLSFGGTLGIVLFERKLQKEKQKDSIMLPTSRIKKYIIEILRVTIAANLIIFPIIAIQFHTVSLTFWISNLLASPLMGAIIIGGFILYITSTISITMGQIVAIPYNALLEIFIKIAEYTGNIPLSKIWVVRPNILLVFIYYFALISIFYHKSITKWLINKKHIMLTTRIQILKRYIKKYLPVILTVNIMFVFVIHIIPANLQIHFIDVGQGDSTLIVTPKHKTILLDRRW